MKRLLIVFALLAMTTVAESGEVIDREALVKRHNPILRAVDICSPLTVGNGHIALTADITGLQTFVEHYEDGVPLATQAYWGWHTFPVPETYTLADATILADSYGRKVGYVAVRGTPASNWLRANPHRIHLGRVGFQFKHADGSLAELEDLTNVEQRLDLWTGVLHSAFQLEGEDVAVETGFHGEADILGVRVVSPLIRKGRLSIVFEFPYPADNEGLHQAEWGMPDRHQTKILTSSSNQAHLRRILDNDRYEVRLGWAKNAKLHEEQKHRFVLTPAKASHFEFVCEFAPEPNGAVLPSANNILQSGAKHWRGYWNEGGAVELSGSTDPRAKELERRIVLSQYLLKVNSSAPMPPQETGLTCNSWAGKAHLEMHWWHGVQFALWGRLHLLEQTMPWYQSILPKAQAMAKSQGYDGARWPKMVGPDGLEGPSRVGVYLIWQQPHPIYYAELFYREYQDQKTLQEYKEIVFESADFMASYAHWEEETQRYVLGPPVIPAQENHPAESTVNPTYELEYWSFGLRVAQRWRERLGLPRDAKWDHVLDNLSKLPQKDGLYTTAESAMNTFGEGGTRTDHPSLLAALGVLPGPEVDIETMRRTLHKVFETWQWDTTWGWDFPMVAMTAARLGEPELALEALLMNTPKNEYLPNGHNYQREKLPLYLPGNGGVLTAVAMMAAGWDDAPNQHAPGFPDNGAWVVRWEGLKRMP